MENYKGPTTSKEIKWLDSEISKELERLGFATIEEALNERWTDIPEQLKEELMKLGFTPKSILDFS